MARAQFQKGQKVWVECVGAWAQVEKVQPVWAKGFEEPVRVTYDVGLGREFQAAELSLPAEDEASRNLGGWRLLRARNKWQAVDDVPHHPYPGTYPVVVTDAADWGGWRVPGAEYDRDPQKIEFQGRLIVSAPRLMALAQKLIDAVAESPEDAPPESLTLAREARNILKTITQIVGAPAEAQVGSPPPPPRPAVAA